MFICAKCFEYTPKKASISSCVWPIRKFNLELSGVIKVTKAQSLCSVQNQNLHKYNAYFLQHKASDFYIIILFRLLNHGRCTELSPKIITWSLPYSIPCIGLSPVKRGIGLPFKQPPIVVFERLTSGKVDWNTGKPPGRVLHVATDPNTLILCNTDSYLFENLLSVIEMKDSGNDEKKALLSKREWKVLESYDSTDSRFQWISRVTGSFHKGVKWS